MAQEIDITGLKKNFNTTVVGDSVIVITQYAVRTVYNRQYYPQSRVYEFNNRPVEAVNYLTFETPLIVTRPSTRLILSGTATNNAILVTGQSVLRAGTSTQVNSVNTASLFVKGSNPIRIPINSLSGGVATVNTFTDILGQPNIYGVAAAGTGTWAFAIEQLPPTQVAGLSINSIITVNTSSNSTGNFGSGNTAYIQSINPNQIIVVANGGTTPVNGTIDGITPTGGTATPSQTGYTVHIFTSNGNFVPTSSVVADVLIVGGGGAGGFGHGAGGGGGAVIYGSSKTISSGTYVVVVGQGGVQSTSNASNNSGGSSSIFGITATGGGAGANEPGDDTSGRSGTGSPGANGGGGGYGGAAGGVGTAPTAAGYSVYAGNAGAPGYSTANFNYGMGGGGGAGGTPTQPSILLGGAGGNGVQIGPITDGVNNYYWGGGGGGTTFGNSNSGTGGSGGLGGGGGATVFGAGAPYPTAGLGGGSAYNSGAAGSVADSGTGGAGGANTGGGGGGGSNENGIGGAGGSGIVVVRYIGTQKATGGIISSVNSAITIPTFRDPNPVGWIFTITNLASTIGYNIGDVISHVGRTGTLGSTSSLVYLTGINTASNSISGISFGSTAPKLGNINAVYPTGESLANVVVSNVSTSTPYTFVVSGLKSTSGLIAGNPGSVITATNVTGSFGAGNTVIVQAILGYTSLLAYVVSGISAPIPGIITNFTATGATLTLPVVGQIAYTTTGTYSWTAPAEVTSVSVVAVGGGGGGSTVWSGGGGGGGGLGWKNNIAVTPGQTYTVVVGTGGPPTSNTTNAAAAGGTSFFISTATVAGYGGGRGGPNATAFGGGYGGGYFGDSGGRGGNGAFQGSWNYGGAGAGGYSGNGADSNGGTGGVSAPTGSGGGAAGGYYSSTQGVPAGGGVGILGRGADGTASGQFNGGGGGSGGQQGRGGEASGQQGASIINGGAFGGGGGGSGTSYGGGWGGVGAVRIIWGTGRSFPVTLTADQGSQPTLPTIITSFKNENVGGSSFVYPSSRIESIPLVLQQNNVPTITPVVVNDPRRLVLQRQVISKTGSEFSLRNSFTFVNINVATTSQYFSTGTLSFTMPVTTNPGGVGFIGTVTQIPILPNIYGVAVASVSSWAFAVENIASTQTSSLSFGRIVTASTSPSSTGNFGTGNTVWVYSTATTGVVVLIASGGSTPPVNGSIDGLTITGGIYNPPLSTNVDLLLVGGGGSGGNHSTTNGNGGGGAGGLLYGTNINLTIGSYPIVIGQGGAAISNATAGNGNRGTSSTFGTIYIANGGGGGGSTGVAFNAAVNNGGSGGGKAESQTGPGLPTQTSQSGATGYGNQGGANSQGWTGAGGGGAGSAGVGGSGGTAPAGDGGQGRAYDISGTMRWYAGGGGGGGNSSERAGDGYAGGGRGAGTTLRYAYNVYTAEVNSITTGSGTPNAIPNTGGGGGGGSYWAPNGGWGSGSGAGGSGIAIVRYLGGQAGSGGTITSAGGYTIHTFTSDGTFVFNGSYGLAVPTFRAPVQSPWIFAITGTSVTSLTTGSVISATPRIGTFGSNNEVYVTSVDTSTNSINCFAWAKGTNSAPPSRGLINAIYPTGELTVLNPIISGITTYGSGYRFTISNIRGTLLYNTGTIFTATPITGTLGTGSTAVVFGIDSFTQIQAYTYGGTAPVAGFIGTPTLSASTATIPQSGDIAYITTGTYSWTAPAGVTSVSVVAVGGGGAGWSAWANAAGAGGGLGWKNNISVTPGNSYTVVVGAGGVRNGGAGGTSFFISTATVAGYGGGNASTTQNTSGPNANGYGGGWFGDGGGAGGNATNYAGGGGAGGYTGNGGNQQNLPAADSGGAAGGGYYSSTYGSGSGGGVGIWGKGATATGWWHGSSGQVFSTSQSNGGGGDGGSGGQRGRSGENPTNSTGESGNVDAPGGRFGGGGGGPGTSWPNAAGSGGGGAVRIIWGPGRAFPATNAGTLTSVVSVATTVFVTQDDNIGGDSNTREALMSISSPLVPRQNTVPTQVLVNANSSIRSTIKNYVHVPTNQTNSTDYEMAPSVTTVINSGTTGTYIYRPVAMSTSSWAFKIYNIPSGTVSSLTSGTIITANTSSVNSGNFGVGNTVSVYTITSATSIIAVAIGGTSAPVAGPIDSIGIPGGSYTYTPAPYAVPVAQYYTVFNGTNQYLTTPANTAFAFGTGDFTVEAWVYLTSTAGSRLVCTRATQGAASGTWSMGLSHTDMRFTEVVSGEPGPSATFASILNTWAHVAAVRGGGVTRLYLNGNQIASATQTTNFSNSSYPLFICTSPSESFIGGYVSNLRIVKGTAVYTSAFTTPTASLTTITNTQLLICKSATQIDLSANALTITPVNSPTITTGALVLTNTIPAFSFSTVLEDLYLGKQTAFVAVVPVSSSTSYFKNRSFTARLQSPGGLPNNLGIINNVAPTNAPGPWTFSLTNMHSTAEYRVGSVVAATPITGSFGSNNTVRVLSITSSTEMVCSARSGEVAPSTGTVAYIQPTGAIDNGPEISAVSFAAVGSWTFVVSNLTSTIMMQVGSVINATTASGSLASFGTGTTAFVSSIHNISQISAVAMGGTAPVAGVIDNVSTSGSVVTFNTGSYVTLTFVAPNGNLTITNNGTTDVTIFKTSGSSSWNNEARVAQAFTAPCTLEFFKQADSSDNGSSYAMMGWNDDPTANESYSSLDYTAYPYRTDNYSVHHNGADLGFFGPWDPAKKFYIVYSTDGFIRHYNGTRLLFSVNYGTGRTVYVDSSFYSPNSTFGGFRNIRVKTAAWQGGLGYGGYGSADYSIVRNAPETGRQDNWDNIVANVTVNTLNRPVNYFGNEVTEPKLVISNAATASIRNAVVPMFELGVTPGNITDITTVTSTTWSFTIDGMRSTSGFTTGTIINSTAVVGSFGLGNQVTVTGVTSSTAMTCITSFGTMIPLAGSITGIYATGEIEPTGPYIEKVIGVNQLSNTTSYSVSFSSAFSSYLQYPNSTQFNLATAGTRWTAECWLKPTGDYSIYNTIFCKRVSGSGTTSYEGFLRVTTGVISFYNGTEYNSDYTLTPNVWSHCAWVYTGSVLNIYVNGVVRYSVSLSLGADNTEPLLIGQARGYTEYFNGLMSNFRLVKNLAVYTGNFTPPTSPLSTTQTDSTNIAAISTGTFTSLLVCQTNTFTDRSVYNTATTVVGTPSISIDNPFGSTSTLTGPWSYVISGLTSTNAFFSSAIVTATSVVGSIGTGTSYVNFVINNRQIAVLNNTVDANIIPGTITNVSTSGVITSTSSPTAVRQVEFNTSPPTSGGTGKYLTTPSTANYNLGTGGDFTVECWIYLTSNGNNAILTLGTGGSATFWFWQVNSDRSLTWQTNSGSWAWANTYTTAASQIPLNSWTHIAAVRSGSNFNMYINGSSAYSTAGFNAGSGASGTLFIGTYYANYNNDGSYFRGNISNLRIVRGTAVYTGNFSVPTAELSNITNTVLLICRSSTFIDNSTNAVTITPVNTPVISISTLFLGSSLGAFPASNYTATVVYPSLFGSRVILQGGDVALSTTIKAFDTEATGVRANVWSTGTAYGNRHVNWVTMTYNSPYSEGQVTGEEAAQPFTVYTRDATVNYGKVQWFVPEPTNLTQGQAISTSTVVVGVIGTSTYVRSTSTSSINAFRITPTTQIRNSFIPVTTDVGGIGVVETIYGGGPWSFTISGLQSVRGFTTGSIISSVARIGSAGQPGNVTYVTSIDTVTNSLTCSSYGSKTPSQGIINSVYPTGEFLPQLRITSITTLTGSSWFFNITGLRGTSGLVASVNSGTIITVTTASGSTGTVGSVSGNSLVVTSIDSQEQIKVFAYGGTTPFAGTITDIVTTSTLGTFPILGDAEFLTPGIYTWVAPAGVTSVSAVAVGGGGAGFNNWSNAAGAGGGLGWRSSISVTSGTSYTVQVGAGGVKNGGAGGTSFFISTATVAGYGGGNASSGQNTSGPNANGYGGGYVGDGGGAGGNATNYAGGGGAGGYSGNGGNQGNLPSAGSGAAAGGGYYSSTYGTGAGGGVGLWGRAETATGWWHGSSGQVFSTSQGNGGGGAGGSGGTRGLSGENPTNSTGESGNVDGYGGTFGGGGGGPGTSWPAASGSGGKGGVRIIWGAGRSFPVNNAGTFTNVVAVTTLSTRSSLIGGPMNFWETQGIITNRMPYPESIAIDRLDTIVITDTITNDAATIKLFAFNNLSSYNAGSRSITNSLVGSETFFVAGTGTDGATSLSAYWI